jgi:hypothetical protein
MHVKHGKSSNKLAKESLLALHLERIMTDILSNEDLWEITKQEPITAQIRKRKWCWIGHTLRKPEGSMEKAELDWNPKGA